MSEFLEIVKKADTGRVWRVLDEFMDALKEARPDVYNDLADVHIHLPGYIFLRKPGFQPALRKNKSFTLSEISSTFHFITLIFLHVLHFKCGKIFLP